MKSCFQIETCTLVKLRISAIFSTEQTIDVRERFDVPHVFTVHYKLVNISPEGTVTVLHREGAVRTGLKLPDNALGEQIRKAFTECQEEGGLDVIMLKMPSWAPLNSQVSSNSTTIFRWRWRSQWVRSTSRPLVSGKMMLEDLNTFTNFRHYHPRFNNSICSLFPLFSNQNPPQHLHVFFTANRLNALIER